MSLSFGIIQGRLTKAPKNRLQFFPRTINIEKEFSKARQIGFDYVELFTERKFNPHNPIWNTKKNKLYKLLSKKYDLKTPNLCDDFIILNNIRLKKNIFYLKRLIKNLKENKIKNLILPLYGKSNMSDQNYLSFRNSLKDITKFAKSLKINILIEANISPEIFFYFKKHTKLNNFYFVFDTGNRINNGRNILDDLSKIFKHIKIIHLKDKNDKNKNVKFGRGNVNFKKIFKILKKKGYKYKVTFESIRGANPYLTARYNLLYFKRLIRKL